MENIPSYGAWLPANIRYDKDLPANAKLLYAELTSLSNLYGYAFATNSYLANLYDLSEDRVSKLIHILEKKGYIKIELERNENNFVVNRKIWIEQKTPSSDGKNDSIGKNNSAPSVKITISDGKNDGSNINTNNNKTININTNSNPFPEPEDVKKKVEKKSKTSFSKSDYSECVKLISSCQNTLKAKGIQIDETQYPIPTLNKWLKKWFQEYGVQETKRGITNSVTDNWLVNNTHYSLSALFSETIFPRLVNNQKFSSVRNNVNYQSEKHSQIDYLKNAEQMPNEEF